MENKVKVWLARDRDERLFSFSDIPNRMINYWRTASCDSLELDCTKFPSVKWEDDEPTEAYITLAEPQEQPKQEQEIDWEQRRYEIAKDILKSLVADLVVESAVEDKERLSKYAINIADTLINKLKNDCNA